MSGKILNQSVGGFVNLPRIVKKCIVVVVDLILCVFALWLAVCLRVGELVQYDTQLFLASVIAISLALPVFFLHGLYREVFRFSGWLTIFKILQAALVYGLFYFLIFTIYGIKDIPRTVGIIQPILLFLSISLARMSTRIAIDNIIYGREKGLNLERVIIYGAGRAGEALSNAILQHRKQNLLGFVDDDPHLRNQKLNGKFIYSPEKLAQLVRQKNIDCILLAMPSTDKMRRSEILGNLSKLPVTVRTVPNLGELSSGKLTFSDVRDLVIEDLLGRDAVQPSIELLEKNIKNKVVLVTGAGGSIGSELCRQVLHNQPKQLLLLEHNEYSLYKIHQELELKTEISRVNIHPILGSVTDEKMMNSVLSTFCPDTLYHAAAYKHVPLVEQNPVQGVKNNIFGTLTIAKAALENSVKNFVLISTDKAVRPTNVMGCTKRLSELILQALAKESRSTCFTMVRFGNVLGSSGSVVPKFLDQIKSGGPVSITHPEVTRFFMTTPEAAQLVIQAGALAKGGEVFLLEMGKPVKIHDLARKMISLSGFTVREIGSTDGDIGIEFVGLRPGEKLFEELIIDAKAAPTIHPKIFQADENCLSWTELNDVLTELKSCLENENIEALLAIFSKTVSGYRETSYRAD